MSDKFLGGSSDNLTNGTANLYIANLTIDNLDPSLPVKTNTTRTLVSEKLEISDVNNLQSALDGKLANPLTADFNYQDFSALNINYTEFNKKASSAASTAGTLKIYANNDGEMHQIDEFGNDTVIGGDTFDQDLNTTDDVEFKSVSVSDTNTWKIDSDGTAIQIISDSDNVSHIMNDISDNKFFALNSPVGALINTYKYRGTISAPAQLAANDFLCENFYYGHNGTSGIPGATVKVQATELWTVGNNGTSYTISTNDTGTATPTQKLKIDDNGTTIEENLIVNSAASNPQISLERNGANSWDIFADNIGGTGQLNIACVNDEYTLQMNPAGIEKRIKARDTVNGVFMSYQRARGTITTPTPLLSGDSSAVQIYEGYDGFDYVNMVECVAAASENLGASNHGGSYTIKTIDNGTTTLTTKLLIDTNGTTATDKLSVDSTGEAEFQIKKNGSTSWKFKNVGAGEQLVLTDNSNVEFMRMAQNAVITLQRAVRMNGGILTINSTASESEINLEKGGVVKWTIKTNASDDLLISDEGGTEILKIDQTGKILIGSSGNEYSLPIDNTTASDNDILVFDSGTDELKFEEPIFAQPFAWIGFETTFQTTINTQNVWEIINGTYVQHTLQDFSEASGTLTYNNATTKTFLVNLAVSWEASSTLNHGYELSVFYNGSILAGSRQGATLDNSNVWPRNASTVAVITLAQNDTLSFRTRNISGTQNIDYLALSGTVSRISD